MESRETRHSRIRLDSAFPVTFAYLDFSNAACRRLWSRSKRNVLEITSGIGTGAGVGFGRLNFRFRPHAA
jgi:hypothetical protein